MNDIQTFNNRWQASGAAERANYQLFLAELCDVISVAHPQPAVEAPRENAYVFEKRVPSAHGTTNFIDLYKRSCFVLEAKQGSDKADTQRPEFSEAALRRRKQRKTGTAVRGTKSWNTAMEKARQQAQTYARSLPNDEIADGRPPFIIVVDVGNTIALYSEFSRTGGNYIPFPDPSSYRLKLDDLHDANLPSTPEVTAPAEKLDWPKALKDRATAVRTILAGFGSLVSVEQVAEGFNGRRTKKRLEEVGEILEMLAELGQIVAEEGTYVV